jgi:hypothetical protein
LLHEVKHLERAEADSFTRMRRKAAAEHDADQSKGGGVI